MIESQVYEVLLYFLVLCILWTFGGYHLFLLILSKFIRREHDYDDSYTPPVTVIIPAYNEEKVIEKKLENVMSLDYAKELLDIIVVDDGSDDETSRIVERYVKLGVKLVRHEERLGKPLAIHSGLKQASGNIVVITDANSFFEDNALRKLVRHFVDPLVGGVGGRYEPKVENGESTGDKLYWKIENFLKERESTLDSIVGMNGNIAVIRKNVLEKVELNKNAIAEDFELSVCIRKMGYRVIYEPEAYSWKMAPKYLKDLILQKERRSIGTIQTLVRHKRMLFNPRFGIYGMLILPSHKLFPMLSPFFLIAAFILLTIMYTNVASIVFLIFLIFILGSIIISKLDIKKSTLTFLPVHLLTVVMSIVFAWINYLRGNYSVTWRKAESTRELIH